MTKLETIRMWVKARLKPIRREIEHGDQWTTAWVFARGAEMELEDLMMLLDELEVDLEEHR